MNAHTQPAQPIGSARSLVIDVAAQCGIDPRRFLNTLRATIVPPDISDEELEAFLTIAKKFTLNPFLREIYAIPKQGGGLQTIVSVDGWSNLISSHPEFEGAEFTEKLDKNGKIIGLTCKMKRKGRGTMEITEYLAECQRDTKPWKQMPLRMLRHRAWIQCGRYLFSFAGMIEPEEEHHYMRDVTPRDGRDAGPPLPDATIKEHAEEQSASSQSTHPETEAEKGAPAAGDSPHTLAGGGAPTESENTDAGTGELFENALALAMKKGGDAHKAGHKRAAMPGEYRDQKRAEEADAWILGWDRFGESVKS